MLDRSVLVLNKSWIPIAITTVKRSFSLVFQDHALIVHPDTYEMHDFETWLLDNSAVSDHATPDRDGWLRTANLLIRIPEVIVLGRYNGVPRRELVFSRRNIYRRDNFECQYCGTRPGLKHLSIDHVVPVSKNGQTTWENCVVACIRCNTRKGNRTPDQAQMPLRCRPGKPTWNDGVGQGESVPTSWARFVAADTRA
ncbi:MAG: HNH endonuclease [Planctomycetes bacterium]|nr:HNH endonuclease [Planctomycetota bacterium]